MMWYSPVTFVTVPVSWVSVQEGKKDKISPIMWHRYAKRTIRWYIYVYFYYYFNIACDIVTVLLIFVDIHHFKHAFSHIEAHTHKRKRPAPPAAPVTDSERRDAGGDDKLQVPPRSRVRGSDDNRFTALRARGAVGINLNNVGFVEQGKTYPLLTVKRSAITRSRNTWAVICGSTNIKSVNKSA